MDLSTLFQTGRRALHAGALVVSLGLAALPAQAQELACEVEIDRSRVNQQNVAFFDDLQRDLFRYLNERRWTDDTFEPEERIECTVRLLVTEVVSQTRFRASFALATRRPVYGTLQRSTALQVLDESWVFDYSPGTPLVFDAQRYDPLLSVVNFYAYLALGFDYDTFGELAGTPHFERARDIAQIASSSNDAGWTSFGGERTRQRLIAQLLDPRYARLRKAAFDLHYGAMDRFAEQPEAARVVVMDALRGVKSLYDEVARPYALDLFLALRGADFVSMLEQSPLAGEAYTLLVAMDPARQSEYNRLVN